LDIDLLHLPEKNAYYYKAIQFDLYSDFLNNSFLNDENNEEDNFKLLNTLFDFAYRRYNLKYIVIGEINETVIRYMNQFNIKGIKFNLKL